MNYPTYFLVQKKSKVFEKSGIFSLAPSEYNDTHALSLSLFHRHRHKHTHTLSLSWQMQYGGDKRQFPGRPLAPFEPWPPSTPVPAPTSTTATTMTMMSTRERRNQNIVKKDNEGCRWSFFLSTNATYPRKQEIFLMPPKKFLKALKFFFDK